jgi:hypothetical protein
MWQHVYLLEPTFRRMTVATKFVISSLILSTLTVEAIFPPKGGLYQEQHGVSSLKVIFFNTCIVLCCLLHVGVCLAYISYQKM